MNNTTETKKDTFVYIFILIWMGDVEQVCY